jgi:hypothetical protein
MHAAGVAVRHVMFAALARLNRPVYERDFPEGCANSIRATNNRARFATPKKRVPSPHHPRGHYQLALSDFLEGDAAATLLSRATGTPSAGLDKDIHREYTESTVARPVQVKPFSVCFSILL